ncbi:DUF2634 domain-containing protein [Paenibacillus sp. FSL H8-0457]|uniref:hypothetical protein n=1 Tax=unclassified Paenibacillus TaxID=185978 RepID=UPI0003E1B972|nr:hypothetical protein [Paenibacillus sp. FSL H8-457]ETT58173.1 hypothetical protein C172_27538 [Paenibacillus sp. FSL H8-457]
MQSLRLSAGDLVLDGDDLVMVDGAAEQAQCVRITLGTNKEEWFLDPDLGIRFETFLGKGLSQEEMIEELRQGIHQLDFIDTVDEISINQDSKTRKQLISFTATTTDGETLNQEVELDGIGSNGV